jgi:hypothetical protein
MQCGAKVYVMAWASTALLLGAGGCGPRAEAPAATAADLELQIQPADTPPEGGLPRRFSLTVVNKSARAVTFSLPRFILSQNDTQESQPPYIILGLSLTNTEGRRVEVIYTHPDESAYPKPQTVVLAPGGAWSSEYPVDEFYFWGPCGPATEVYITKVFRAGNRSVQMRAVLQQANFADFHVESESCPVQVSHEAWIFN